MVLHLRMRRNVTRTVYNAQKHVNVTNECIPGITSTCHRHDKLSQTQLVRICPRLPRPVVHEHVDRAGERPPTDHKPHSVVTYRHDVTGWNVRRRQVLAVRCQ